MFRTFACTFVFTGLAAAQPIGVGIKGGVPLTEAFETVSEATRGYLSKNRMYIVGPQFELRLPAGFGVELDALYTRLNFEANVGQVVRSVTSASSWEFPLLAKYTFGGRSAVVASVRPFVDTGLSFRRITDINQIGRFLSGGTDATDNPPELRDKNNTGFVFGGGLEIRVPLIRITPEFRFTRWGTDNFRDGVAGLLSTNRNQGQFLVGFGF